jgi:sorting nexin-1/2
VALIAGKTEDAEEDPEYLKVREYVGQLETHLAEAHKQAARLIRRQDALSGALADFGASMVGLGKFEGGDLAQSFMRMGDKAELLSKSAREQSASLSTSFEAPLKEFVRLVKSAKATMADRGLALAALHTARSDVAGKRSKLMKLRGTPGIREDKVAEVERELNEAQYRVEGAQATFDTIVSRMKLELARFQEERAEEMAAVLRDFAIAQARTAQETADTWRTLIPPGGDEDGDTQ